MLFVGFMSSFNIVGNGNKGNLLTEQVVIYKVCSEKGKSCQECVLRNLKGIKKNNNINTKGMVFLMGFTCATSVLNWVVLINYFIGI